MSNAIEIYLRHSNNGTMLNFHVPVSLKERFLRAVGSGELDLTNDDANFEAVILPEWSASEEAAASPHVRMKISGISVNYYEDD